ncbi:MAG: hypothetical protein HY704_02405 [Gemmatimonadetes bacterium]|nr:hypothetical protein [Gemmatimonadota bacterium]
MLRRWITCGVLVVTYSLVPGLRAEAAAQGAGRRSGDRIPTPSEFHGFDVGQEYIITSALYDYYRELARLSPRVEYGEYGRSIQGRPLPILVVSSEENLARKDEIRERIRLLTEVTAPLPESELVRLTAGTPAVVWIYIVDTDEEAGVNALQEVAHELATREDEDARRIRENLVVVFTPLTNPDAQARYVTWHKIYDVDGASLDPNAVENRAHWGMNTDGNAYGIDVNRDFSSFVTPELQALVRVLTGWRPQMSLDIHSGPNVLFMGPFPPPHHPLWPREAPKWWEAVAERASEEFGREGWSFSNRSGYDGVVDIGHSHSWAMLAHVTAGFLYETFAGRPGRTTVFRRSDGTIGTMRMAMDRHRLGIWSALQVAAERRDELLRDAHRGVVAAADAARTGAVRGIVVPVAGPGVDPDKVHRLVDRLTLQGVEVRRAARPFTARVRDFYALETTAARELPAGSYVVDFVQPRARLARALLDPTIRFEDPPQISVTFGRTMPFSDVTWGNLPYLFGVPAYAADGPLPAQVEIVAGPPPRPALVNALDAREPTYAYILAAGREASYRVAIRLMREGYRLRVFHGAFRIGDREYPKGTWAALRLRNPEGLGERLIKLAEEHGAEVVAVAGPYTDAGVTFGDDDRLAAIPEPRVAVLADWPVTQDHVFGGIRNVLEADFGFAFTPVMLETVNTRDLSGYTAVVLPHAGMDIRGGPNFDEGYRDKLNLENLRRYVRGGGTLLAVKGAAEVVAGDEVLGRDVDVEGWARYTSGPTLRARWEAGPTPEAEFVPWRPGLDETGFPLLAAGYERQEFAAPAAYPVLLSVRDGGAARVVARYTPDAQRLLLEGYMHDSDRPRLAGRPFVVVAPVGRGRVIYFADSTTFRGYWYGLNLLFLNSLIFGPTL